MNYLVLILLFLNTCIAMELDAGIYEWHGLLGRKFHPCQPLVKAAVKAAIKAVVSGVYILTFQLPSTLMRFTSSDELEPLPHVILMVTRFWSSGWFSVASIVLAVMSFTPPFSSAYFFFTSADILILPESLSSMPGWFWSASM